MLQQPPTSALPAIIVSEAEEARLSSLATAASLTGNSESVALTLLAELDRAKIVREADVPADTVRMYSTVEFHIDNGKPRRAQIVYPGEANIDEGRISILTPIGAALIGLSPNQTMSLQGHDGRDHKLTVLSVAQSLAEA